MTKHALKLLRCSHHKLFKVCLTICSTLCIKGLKRQIRETVFVVLSLEDLKSFSLRLYVYDMVLNGTSKHLFQINGDILKR